MKFEPIAAHPGEGGGAAGEGAPDPREEFLTITKHGVTAKLRDRRDERRPDPGPRLPDHVGHRRLRGHRPARDPQVRLHERRAIRHPERPHRLVQRVHEQAARGRLPRLRHHAGLLGLRVPDGHHRQGDGLGPGGVPPARTSPRGRHPGHRHRGLEHGPGRLHRGRGRRYWHGERTGDGPHPNPLPREGSTCPPRQHSGEAHPPSSGEGTGGKSVPHLRRAKGLAAA